MGDPILFLYVQAGAFLLGYLLAFGRKWKRFFITKREMKEEVYQKAIESFREYGLHKESNTILLFASLLERRVEIITSGDIENEKENEIQKALDQVRTIFKGNRPETALKEITKILSPEVPPPAQEKIEGPNRDQIENDKTETPSPRQNDVESPQSDSQNQSIE